MVSVARNNTPALRFDGFDGEWEKVSLGDLGIPISGVGFPHSEQGGETGTPFFKVSDMGQSDNQRELLYAANYVSAEQIKQRRWQVSNGPAVVFAKVGAAVLLDRKRLVRETFLADNNLMAFVISQSVLLPDFSLSLFETLSLSSLVQVGALPSINGSQVQAMMVSIPPTLQEQRAVGELFSDLDALIEQHRAKHANLQQTKTALMQRMFPQDGADEPELRLGGFSGVWETVSFDSLLTRVEIGTNILGSNRYHGIPLLKMGNIQRGYFDFSSFERLPDNAELPSGSLVRTGDFLFNTRNTMELVGKGATWMGESGAFVFNGNIARFTLERVDTKFFNYLYNHPRSIRDVSKCATGTTSVAAIYPRSLKSVQFQIPTLEEQRAVGEVFSNLDALIAAEDRYVTQLKQAKTALLQRMFV